ncbi:MAG: lipocalin-like domain-containing protein [Muribaculum sp.]|nr:lipocalin-like domain-containing protein [Muribaculum sp.]
MKKIIAILFLLPLLTTITGCTTNNGDIGPLMGQWKLYEIDIDGIPDANYPGNIFWQFQSHVMSMRRTNQYHDQQSRFGSWAMLTDDIMEVNFTHTDNKSPESDYRYTPFQETMLPRAIFQLNILTLNSSTLIVTYFDESDRLITYRLVKW